MILCDTNILIDFYKNRSDIVGELHQIGHQNIAISSVSQAELYFGALNKNELRQIKDHLSLLDRIPITKPISDQFIELMEKYALSHKLTIPDGLIAATALVHGYELYTLNTRDFRYLPKLQLYQPQSYQR
jgi:predicted nucleic acid-binding protein